MPKHPTTSAQQSSRPNRRRTHGLSRTRIWYAWHNMIYRCHDPKHRQYRHYGGRGILVCERWRQSLENFLEDMGHPAEGMSLDRIDNSKGYEPGNCRWTDMKTQMRNKRNNVLVEWRGKSVSVAQFAEEVGIKHNVILSRLSHGWSLEEIATTPVAYRTPRHKRGA